MFEFKRAVPEDVGISSADIMNTLLELDDKNVPMHSFLLMKGDALVFEKYYYPYKQDTLHRMFSISKSFTGVAIGLLQDEGKLDIDDPVSDYFPEYVDESTHPWIREMTIRNMLMMRTCHASTTYKVDMKSDWVESFFKVAPTHRSGTVFHYDTSAAHVLCALVEKISSIPMLDYMKDRMLRHVSFSEDSYMVKDPFGVSMGGSGLMATPMDVMKFLFILKNKGTVKCADGQVRTIAPTKFIEEATSNLTDTFVTAPISGEAQGYGMQIWQNAKGGFLLYGMGGQLGISLPQQDLLIVTTADTQGMQGGNQIIYDAIYHNLLKESDEGAAGCRQDARGDSVDVYRELCSGADTLVIGPPRLPKGYGASGCDSFNQKNLGRLRYRLTDNPQGFEEFFVDLTDPSHCSIAFEQKESLCEVVFGIGSMCEGEFPIYGTAYTAGGIWSRENVLYIRVHLVGENVGSVHFQLFFGDDDITVFMRKIEETYFREFDGHLYGTLMG